MNHRKRTTIFGLLVVFLGIPHVAAGQAIAVTELRLHQGDATARKAVVVHAADVSGEFSFRIPVADPLKPVELPKDLRIRLRDQDIDVAHVTALSYISGSEFATVVVKPNAVAKKPTVGVKKPAAGTKKPAPKTKFETRVSYELAIPGGNEAWEQQLFAAPSEDHTELRRELTLINPTAERLDDDCKILLSDSAGTLSFSESLGKLGGPLDPGKTRTASLAHPTHLDWDTVQIDLQAVPPGNVGRHLTIDHRMTIAGGVAEPIAVIQKGSLSVEGTPNGPAGLPADRALVLPNDLLPYLPSTESLSAGGGLFTGRRTGNVTRLPIGDDADVSVLSSGVFIDEGRFPVGIDQDSLISLAVSTHVVQILSARDDVPVRFWHSGAGHHVLEEQWAKVQAGSQRPWIAKSVNVAVADVAFDTDAAALKKSLEAALKQLEDLAFQLDTKSKDHVPRIDRLYLFRTEPKIALSVAKETDPKGKLSEYAIKLRSALKAKIAKLASPPVVDPQSELNRERREIEKAIAEIRSSPKPDDFWREFRYLTDRHEYLLTRIGDLRRTKLRNDLPRP